MERGRKGGVPFLRLFWCRTLPKTPVQIPGAILNRIWTYNSTDFSVNVRGM